MFDPPQDRPQSTGDLIGRAFRLHRRHLPLFFKILIIPTIIATLGQLGLQWVFIYGLPSENGDTTWLIIYLAILLCSLIMLCLSKWVLTIRQLSLLRVSAGFSTDYQTALTFVNQRKWLILALHLLGLVAIVGVVMISVMSMVLLMALPRAGVPAMLIFVTGFISVIFGSFAGSCLVFLLGLLIMAVLSCEDLPLNTVISRGLNLASRDFGRTCAFGMLLFAAVAALSYPLMLPVVTASVIDRIQHEMNPANMADTYQLPFYILAFTQIWESLINMFLWPAIFLAYGLFYYDLRLRQEGLDIARSLELLEQS